MKKISTLLFCMVNIFISKAQEVPLDTLNQKFAEKIQKTLVVPYAFAPFVVITDLDIPDGFTYPIPGQVVSVQKYETLSGELFDRAYVSLKQLVSDKEPPKLLVGIDAECANTALAPQGCTLRYEKISQDIALLRLVHSKSLP